MRSITSKKNAAQPEFGGDTLMCLIEIPMDEIVGSGFRKCSLQPSVNGFIA